MTDVEYPTCLLCVIICQIPMPRKMISCMLCDVTALFEGNVGVKILKGACFLGKEFLSSFNYLPSAKRRFYKNFHWFKGYTLILLCCKKRFTWSFCLNAFTLGAYMWTKCSIASNTWIVSWDSLLMNHVCVLCDVMLTWNNNH